ncbi:cathepsin D [Aphelenchoides avenae]|nr:cathepsin D [Aphelenchus avenae]
MSLLRCATLWLAVAALSTAVDVDDLKKSDEVTTVPLYTYRDEAYAADVLVGTPPQKVRLAFRSSSEDTVVAAKLCSACCKHELFDSTTSSTYQATGETWKSHHQRLIYYSSDVLQAFGETKKNFSFFLTVFSNGTDDFADQPFDGHFNSLLLLDKKGFPKHFTFYAKRTCANGVTDPTKTTAGVITVGGKDETNCDKELVSVPSV